MTTVLITRSRPHYSIDKELGCVVAVDLRLVEVGA